MQVQTICVPRDGGDCELRSCLVATPEEAERLGLKKSEILLMLEGELPATPEQLELCRQILYQVGNLRDGYVLLELPDPVEGVSQTYNVG